MITEFYKGKLNTGDKIIYERMLNDFSLLRVESDLGNKSSEDAISLYKSLYYDHVELFYLSTMPQLLQNMGFFGVKNIIRSKHIFSEKEILNYKSKMLYVVEKLKNITNSLTDEIDKEVAICDYFIENVYYEINNKLNQNAATVIVYNKGQCSGIAKAIKYIFDCLGMYCLVVDGTLTDNTKGITGAHAWNIVRINGQYYHLDVTSMIGSNPQKKRPYYHNYFNETDDKMRLDHSWDTNFYPCCNVLFQDVKNNVRQTDIDTTAYKKAKNVEVGNNGYEVINSYWDFIKVVKRLYDNKATAYEFISGINEKDSDSLCNHLLKQLNREAEQRNISLAISVSVNGNFVTLRFDW